MTLAQNVDRHGVARYPVGQWPILDPDTGEVLIDELGRRSFTTSIAYGPSVGKNIALGYLPERYAKQGRALAMEYFGERYPLRVEAVGQLALYDPQNERPKS
jgi:glycine cleavage system aminomethyltransferase T